MKLLPLSVRSGWRLAGRDPGVSVAIVVMLAIGVGIAGLGRTVLSSVLGHGGVDVGRVARLGPSLQRADGGLGVSNMRLPLLREVRRQASSFSEVVGVRAQLLPFEGGGLADELQVAEVTEGFSGLVGVHPSIGRSFVPSDWRPGAPPVCVLGNGAWQRGFGGQLGASGGARQGDRRVVLVRSTFADRTLSRRFAAILVASAPGWAPQELTPFVEFVGRPRRELDGGVFLTRLVGVIGLVTLILAALGLFAVTQQAVHAGTRELGIRAAVGATPGHLLRLVYRRSLAQTALGTAVALGGTLWGLSVGFGDALHVGGRDPRVWVVVVVALGAPCLGGYLPARRAARIDPARVMRDD